MTHCNHNMEKKEGNLKRPPLACRLPHSSALFDPVQNINTLTAKTCLSKQLRPPKREVGHPFLPPFYKNPTISCNLSPPPCQNRQNFGNYVSVRSTVMGSNNRNGLELLLSSSLSLARSPVPRLLSTLQFGLFFCKPSAINDH